MLGKIEKVEKRLVVEEHGTVYAMDNEEFIGYALLREGGFDEENSFLIEEAPTSYKARHKQILADLGVDDDDADKILEKISYYEEKEMYCPNPKCKCMRGVRDTGCRLVCVVCNDWLRR